MRFTINLATRTYLNTRLVNQILGVLIAVLVLLSGWNISRMATNLGELQLRETEVKQLEARLKGTSAEVPAPDLQRQQASIRFFNGIIERKSVAWLHLLDQVEAATPEGIALTVLAPGKKPGELKLEGRARSFAAVRLYLEKLESAQGFTQVLLLSHQSLLLGEKGRGVQFAISCKVPF